MAELTAANISPENRGLHPVVKGGAVLVALTVFSFLAAQQPGKIAGSFVLVLLVTLIAGHRHRPGGQSDSVAHGLGAKLRSMWVLLAAIAVFSGLASGWTDPLQMVGTILAVVGIMLTAITYAVCTPQNEMTAFFETLFFPLRPFGSRDRQWALAMVVGIRFLPDLASELERLRLAQIARGIPLRGGPPAWKDSFSLMVPAVVSAIHRARSLALAMEVRGFHLDRHPTRFRGYQAGTPDLLVIAGLTAWVWWVGWA